jgi:serine protease inhibitor
LKLAREYYQTKITPVNYKKNPKEAQRLINAWVARETKSKIKNIITDTPPNLTRMILVNAIYFKGDWLTKFDKFDTINAPFYLNKNNSIDTPMMHQQSDFNYGEDEILQVLEMPYTSKELSMVIFLPREIEGYKTLEDNLSVGRLEEYTKRLSRNKIKVYVPRFKITNQFNLKNVLTAMGMTDAFDMNKANFAGMDGNPNWLYIEFAVHKAFVDVNEEGTEAAAVTAGGCFPSGTEVLTEIGPRPIETLDGGKKVLACNLDTGEWVLAKVLKQQTHKYEGDMITIQMDNKKIRATGNHPFFVLNGNRLAFRPQPRDVPKEDQGLISSGRWVEARHLKKGDVLMGRDGKGLIVSYLSSSYEKAEVYNLSVDGYHNYAIHHEGILVHNKAKSAPPEPILFRADHPFLFLIRDKSTKTILFMGRVSNPSTE